MKDSKTLIELIRENLVTWEEMDPNVDEDDEDEGEKKKEERK